MAELFAPEKFAQVRRPLDEASWMPKEMYLEVAVYDREVERIFRKEWLFAIHISELPNIGDYVALTIVGEPVLITRAKDGKIRTFYNVCRHRAMAVVTGRGNSPSFICPYHAWSYAQDGSLIAAPGMDKTKNFKSCDIKLTEIRSELVNGMLFINFDEQAASLATQIPDMVDIIAPWDIGAMEAVHVSEIGGNYNWKVMLENANENYHTIAVHRESFHSISPAEHSYSSDGTSRRWHDLYTPYTGPDKMTFGPKIPDVPEWSSERLSFFALHPQFLMSVSSDSVSTYVTHIEGPNRTRFVWTMYMMKGSKENPALADYIAGMAGWIDQINEEDLAICEGVQQGMQSAGWQPARFSHLEKSIWQFQNWYLDRILDTATSRRLKAV